MQSAISTTITIEEAAPLLFALLLCVQLCWSADVVVDECQRLAVKVVLVIILICFVGVFFLRCFVWFYIFVVAAVGWLFDSKYETAGDAK